MLSSGKWLFTVVMVALVSQLRLAVVDQSVKDSIIAESQSSSYARIHKDKILNALDVIATTEDFDLTTFLSVNDKGVNVLAKSEGKEFIARILIGDESITAINEEIDLKDDSFRGINYINILDSTVCRVGKVDDKEFTYCILMFEKHDTSLTSSTLFDPKIHQHKGLNAARLFRFFGKLVFDFAKLNFSKRILHGNVNSKTIFVKYDESRMEIDPVINDFTLMLENKSKQDLESNVVRYERDYRSPELKESITNSATSNSFSHKYSGDFLEDVYAIGHLIQQTLLSQIEHLDENQCEYKQLQKNAETMKGEKSKTSDNRSVAADDKSEKYKPNMKLVLADFVTDIEGCLQNHKDPLNLSFVHDAKALLLTFNKEILII